MPLINPGIGIIFWMTLTFALLLFVLGKYAWPAILNGLREREQSIQEALDTAKKTHEEMKLLKIDNEKLLKEAKEERDAILHEARKIKDKIVNNAKERANREASKIVESAKVRIENEKKAAIVEIKNTIATYSIAIAEKILRVELSDAKQQKDYVNKLLKETNLN